MAFDRLDVVRVRGRERDEVSDRVAVEEPLEVQLHGQSFAVIMRTPGADRELAAGFLFAERVIRSGDDLGTIEHCTVKDSTSAATVENVVNVTLLGAAREALDAILAERRHVLANSSCGVCGRQTIDSLRADLAPVSGGPTISSPVIGLMLERLRTAQPVFDATGGLHAAGVFDRNGALLSSAEDVGRHNAVDKVIGRLLLQDALPLTDRALSVSGRTSFEIVQKAWCASIPIIASVSAPSSLAIAVAREAGITLVGFVRDGGFNIYAHPERIT